MYSSLFQAFSLETTAKDASRFLKPQTRLPEGIPVNIAFLSSETFEQRLAAIDVLHASGLQARPIISARRLTSSDALQSFFQQAIDLGPVRGLFLVGGDPRTPEGPFVDSMDVINGGFLDGLDIQTVGIAGYPEGHPRIGNDVLWDYLHRKIDALMSRGFKVEITTQLSFDPEAVITWLEQVRKRGIDIPVRVGIPSPSSVSGMLGFAKQCRVATSAQLLQRYGWQAASLLGSVGPERFLSGLLQAMEHRELGDVRLHLFPLGDVAKAVDWLQAFERRSLA